MVFTLNGRYYKPILYMNDFWNLNRDYQPLNKTVKQLQLRLTYQPLSLFKWQFLAAHSMKNKWTAPLMGKLIYLKIQSLYAAQIILCDTLEILYQESLV